MTLARVLPFVVAQMDPVAVLEALEAVGYTPDALEAVGRRIICAEVVGVDDLVAAGLSGGSVVAVRRALDPSVSEQTHGCVCWVGPGEVESEVHGGVRAQRSVPCPALLCSVVCCGHIDVCRGLFCASWRGYRQRAGKKSSVDAEAEAERKRLADAAADAERKRAEDALQVCVCVQDGYMLGSCTVDETVGE